MIRTLFVEDEFFVRRGFIHSLRWDEYGIEIIGEADNGESALEFLRQEQVDLLITDLTMPIMSGLELIRAAKSELPDLSVVVLTCHRDFDFVQEALRLGALDYIIKTRLETNEIEGAFNRIVNKLKGRKKAAKQGVLLRAASLAAASRLSKWNEESGLPLVKLGSDGWWLPDSGALSQHWLRELQGEGVQPLIVEGAQDVETRALYEGLTCYVHEAMFYRNDYSKGVETVSWHEIKQNDPKSKDTTRIRELWSSYCWLFEQGKFEDWCKLVRDTEPPVHELNALLHESMTTWLLADGLRQEGVKEQLFDHLTMWEQWENQLRTIRDMLVARCDKQHLSRDVLVSVLRSLDIIRHQLRYGSSQNEVAKMVNLSRSYFSQVFKDTCGMSFYQYGKECSFFTAKKLLMTTNHPIYWIAEQSGFQDERYFSRIFREKTGMLPSEYRGHANV
ncbi:response regulator transcription factor [Paenibacillus silvisoli]|uniref:response regulator transcription factor n=1 Tax=Paenibacillus silvisoli TaxID=3110539 RepID=UPI0028048F71|nr:response regulator [Paenibacillus silvisoli]